LNFSAPFVKTILDTIDSIQDDYDNNNNNNNNNSNAPQSKPAARRRPYNPYYVVNHLGDIPIRVAVIGEGNVITSDLAIAADAQPQPLPIQSPHDATLKRTISMSETCSPWKSRSQMAARNCIVISLAQYGKLRKIDISAVATHSLATTVGRERVIVGVTVDGGSKLVSVRSRISIHNCTNRDIRLAMVTHSGDKRTQALISAQSTLPVPLTYVADGIVMFSPDSADYGDSISSIDLGDLIRANGTLAPTSIMCPNVADPSKRAFYLNASASINASTSEITIELHAPLVLENLMLAQVEYQVGILNAGSTAVGSRIRKRDIVYSAFSGRAPMPVAVTSSTHGDGSQIVGCSGRLTVGHMVEIFEFESVPRATSAQQALVLSIRLPGFDRWSAPATITGDLIAVEITMDDRVSRLGVRVERTLSPNRSSATIMLYTDFWLINRTGQRLMYANAPAGAQMLAGQAIGATVLDASYTSGKFDAEAEQATKLVLFSDPNGRASILQRQSRISLKVANSLWSDMVNISSASSGTLAVPFDSSRLGAFQLGVSIKDALHKFWRTKIVTFVPQYLIVNETEHDLHYMQPHSKRFVLAAHQHAPFHWENTKADKAICIRLQPSLYQWSCALQLGVIYSAVVRLPPFQLGSDAPDKAFYRVTVKDDAESGSWLVVVSREKPCNAPYRIVNRTDIELRIHQRRPDATIGYVL
jgi:hypothetical protein